MPFEMWHWEAEVGAPQGAMQAWRTFDLRAEVARISEFPVYLCNDATAGCAAVHLFGQAASYPEFLYVFIAWFIGGGVVINGNLFPGRSGYAGSLGQILVPAAARTAEPAMKQLLHRASIYVLAEQIAKTGGDPTADLGDGRLAGRRRRSSRQAGSRTSARASPTRWCPPSR